MKKISAIIILAVIMTAGGVKPAAALKIDAAQMAGKVNDFVQAVSEGTTKVSQQVNQVKQMSVQGFNKDNLLKKGKEFLKARKYLSKQLTGLVKGTKKKNKDVLSAEKKLYEEANKAYYEQKVEIVVENKAKIDASLQAKKAQEPGKRENMELKKAEYEKAIGTKKEKKAHKEYMEAESEYTALVTAIKELETLSNQLAEQIEELEKEKAKVGTSEDAQYVALQKREEKLDAQEEDLSFTQVESEEEWDNPNGVEKYILSEKDYQKFIKRYFYNPNALDSSGEDARLNFQSEMDRVMRERRYLVINTAAHLLQVTATVRREIPVRTKAIDAMFKNTPASSGELEAISSYAATRIESARSLLLYAKLLSAKIQYMAAKDLVDVETKKKADGTETYKDFNLDKYILTDDYVKNLVKEANPEIGEKK